MTTWTEESDVVVVGGGPAGSTAAALIAMHGYRVVLLEKEGFPRHQIGESLLPATIHGVMRQLGVFEELHQAGFMVKYGGSLRWGQSSEPWSIDFSRSPRLTDETAYAFQVERMKFDVILLENARRRGVDVREGCRTDDVIQQARVEGVRYTDGSGTSRALSAPLVVDASGHASRIEKRVGGTRLYSELFRNVAVYGYFEHGKRFPGSKAGNILSAAFADGWIWYIPLSQSLTSVGAVVHRDALARLRGDELESTLHHFISKCAIVSDLLSEARRVTDGPYGKVRARRDYSYCNDRFWRPGMALVGDAACFVDPLFSSGVHLATYSAALAAEAAVQVLSGKAREEDAFNDFEDQYRREYVRFYRMLDTFYSSHIDEDSYYRAAREITQAESPELEAFVDLVAGTSSGNPLLVPPWSLRSNAGGGRRGSGPEDRNQGAMMVGDRAMVPDPPGALRLRADLRLAQVDPGRVELAGEGYTVVVEGDVASAVVPLLDGSRTLEQVAMELFGRASVAEVVAAVGDLERQRYVVHEPLDGDRQEAAFWEPMGLGAAEAAARLSRTTVEVVAVGNVDVQPLSAAMVELGVQVVPGEQASLVCVFAEDYLLDELGGINKAMLGSRRRWLLARPLGRELWLGPLFEPGATGCWACLARALSAGDADGKGPGLMLGKLRAAQRALAELVATKVAEIVVGGTIEALRGRLVTLDSRTLSSESHLLMRYPDCPSCGVATPRPEQGPLVLQATPKATWEGGGHRARSLAETSARLERQVSRRLGVVRDLKTAVGPEEAALHVWSAGMRVGVAGRARSIYGGRGWGKGRNDLQARVGALAEAHELACGTGRGDEPVERGRLADRGESAVSPQALLQFSSRQYDNRELTNPAARPWNQVPERFDPDTELAWSRVWSLTHERTRELPAALCWFGPPVPGLGGANSNGCAAGSTLEEAILHGVGELIERDSVALWWYSRARRPGVDLDSFADPYYDLLQERLAELGRELWVMDLSTDLGVPSFVALSCLADGRRSPVLGYGANLDAATAISRAVTEHNQILAARTSPSLGRRLANPLAHVDAVRESWLLPDPAAQPRRAGDYASTATDDIAKDVAICVARLAEANIEVLVLDQSRPDCELRVVRVTAPGLRHWWRRLAPGRLYDVPPAIGWIEAPLTEEQLNPLDVV